MERQSKTWRATIKQSIMRYRQISDRLTPYISDTRVYIWSYLLSLQCPLPIVWERWWPCTILTLLSAYMFVNNELIVLIQCMYNRLSKSCIHKYNYLFRLFFNT